MYKNLDIRGIGISGTQSEVIELSLSYGFQGMSLDMESFARQVEEHGLDHARRLIDSARIPISTFRLPLDWSGADEATYQKRLAEVSKLGELAAALGCARCVTAVPAASDERPYHENFEFARKRLTEIAEALAPHGVRIGLELDATAGSRQGRAFQFIHDFDALRQLAKALPANVGVVVDPWQMQVAGADLDAIKSLTNNEIVAVYLSDLPEEADLETVDATSRLLPGETGAIDAPAVLTALVELGYDGPVTPRAYRKALEEQSREAIVKLAGERIEAAWKGANLDENGQFAPVEEEVES